jgi:hypothetical protein
VTGNLITSYISVPFEGEYIVLELGGSKPGTDVVIEGNQVILNVELTSM